MKRCFIILIVLSICTVLSAQDIIVKRDGTRIDAIVQTVGDSEIFYKAVDNQEGPGLTIMKSDVLTIVYQNGKVETFEVEEEKLKTDSASVEKHQIIAVEDIHGYILGRGRNVYVTSNSKASYEQPAVEALKEEIAAHKYWNVVENVEEAHFVVQFGICTSGSDRAFVYARTRESYAQYPSSTYDIWLYKVKEPGSMIIGVSSGSEDGVENANIARNMVNSIWFRSFEIEDDDPVLTTLKNGEKPSRHIYHIERDNNNRIPGTAPASWYIAPSLNSFWKWWSQFYVK